MSDYKYNDAQSAELRKILKKLVEKNRETDPFANPPEIIHLVLAVLSTRFDLVDDVDRAMFISNLVSDFANGCNIDFSKLLDRAAEIQTDNDKDKVKS